MTEEMHATCVLERVSWIQKLIFSSSIMHLQNNAQEGTLVAFWLTCSKNPFGD